MTMVVNGEYKKNAAKSGDIPASEHWAIVVYDSVSESDGWGGTSSTAVTRYYVYLTQPEWAAAVLDLQRQKMERKYGVSIDFIAFHVDKVAKLDVEVRMT